MDTAPCSQRPVLVSCSLPDFEYQIDPYIGCSQYYLYCYVLDQAEANWREKIIYHADIVGQLRDELAGIPSQTSTSTAPSHAGHTGINSVGRATGKGPSQKARVVRPSC